MTVLDHRYSVDIVLIMEQFWSISVLAGFLQTIALLTFHR